MRVDNRTGLATVAAAALIGCFCLLVLASSERMSAWYDEAPHFDFGLTILETGGFKEDLPCSFPVSILNALPFFLSSHPPHPEADWINGFKYLHLLQVCRIPTLALACLCALCVFLWARDLFGRRGALLSLALFCFSPDIINYARWISTDMPATACCFIACYFFRDLHRRPSVAGACVAGAALGLALLTKFTAILLIPVWLALALLPCGNGSGGWRKRIPLVLAAIALGLVFLNAGYEFQGTGTRLDAYGSFTGGKLLSLGAWGRVPLPLPRFYAAGLLTRQYMMESPTWFMGNWSTQPRWYYLPVAFLIKTPLPVLIGMLVVVAAYRAFRRPPAIEELMLLAFPAVVFLAFFNKPHIFHRYLLPAYPFLFVLLGRLAWPRWVRGRGIYAVMGVAGMAWYVGGSIVAYPHYLAYFNELIGGPRNGYRYFVGPELECGESWILASEYQKQTKRTFVAQPPFKKGDLVVITARNLMLDKNRWLRDDYTPVDRIGYGLFVYDLSRPGAPRPVPRRDILY